VEPPSRQLLDLLSRYRLATARDLRRCRPHVRRLARDLPTFDFLWIDALTRTRTLTPFQARVLESDRPDGLAVGPCVLIDELAREGRWILRSARHRHSGRRCLLTFITVPADGLRRAVSQVREMISRLRGAAHSSLLIPQGCDEHESRLVVVSPDLTGPTLRQLLIRRGRFPLPVVAEIAGQLIAGLSALQERDVVHGDLSLDSIRLTTSGQAVLLHPGVFPAIGSRVSIHDSLPPECYDGTAPELIGTGRTATFPSDVYALGCTVWQLLTARPPQPTGDPLAKLAAHRSRPVDDLRRWVPDAPAAWAEWIARLTARDPDRRPRSASELAETCPLGRRRTRRKTLARFHASFGTVAPRHGGEHRSASKFPQTVAAVLMLLLGSLAVWLVEPAAIRERLAAITGRPLAEAAVTLTVPDRKSALLAFPTVPRDGVIELPFEGPYDVGSVNVSGPLVIRAGEGVSPQVIVRGTPLRLTASHVQIEQIRITQADDAEAAASALLQVRANSLALQDCRFDARGATVAAEGGTASRGEWPADNGGGAGPQADPVRTTPSLAAITWDGIDEADPAGGRCAVVRCVLTGPMQGIETHAMPRTMGVDQCLKTGPGAFVRCVHSHRSLPLRLHVRHTTLRDSGGVIRWSNSRGEPAQQPTLMVLESCVFDISPAEGALVEFGTTASPVGWDRLLRITGEESLLSPRTILAASGLDEPSTSLQPLAAENLRVDGLLIDTFTFAGPVSAREGDSLVTEIQTPRASVDPPGITPEAWHAPRSAQRTPTGESAVR
jgi:hypothetical protein